MKPHISRALLACMLALCWNTAPAAAANFSFSPDRLEMAANERSGVVTLFNAGSDPIRFEARAMRWQQKPDGTMDLQPTDDVLVYPPLVTIAPKEQRLLRVTVLVPPGDMEKTYRIGITEIPNFTGVNSGGSSVTIRSQLELPVFYSPQAPRPAAARIESANARGGTFAFDIVNGGSVRFLVQHLILTGLAAGERVTFKKPLDGWYVLAGQRQSFAVELSRADCNALRAITIDMDAGAHVSQTVSIPADACRP